MVTALIAHPRMFTGFFPYDDEGYMLSALHSFVHHGHLYNDVFTQYGPFYYEFWGSLFSTFGVSVNHDNGRTATMVVWILTGLLFGLIGWRITRSVLLGLATQVLTFNAIWAVTNEPMHPGGLICLLLGVILAIACWVRARPAPLAMGLLGGAVMGLILVKVNVGVFALFAVALVCVVSYPSLLRRRWLRPAMEALFVAVPFLVMASKLGQGWAREYALHVGAAALAVVVALRGRAVARRDGEELWWLGGGLALMALAVAGAILASGTTPGALVEGVITQPLRQSDVFSLHLLLADRVFWFDLLAVVGAGAYAYVARSGRSLSPGFAAVVSLLSILAGLEMALSVVARTPLFEPIAFPGYPFGYLGFAWVALIPTPGREDGDTAFARLLLPPLVALQALHAYPVAGSQVQWGTFLLAPAGAVCVANGVRGVAALLSGERERRALGALAVAASVAAVLVFVNTQLRQPLKLVRDGYDAAPRLNLPGAEEVRLNPEEVTLFRRITHAIDRDCASFLTLPGMNSFYVWTRMEPPTGFNATDWMALFDEAHQRRVIEATRSTRDLCLLKNEGLLAFWEAAGEPPSDTELVHYLGRGFRPLESFGGYELLRREGAAGGSS